eukprot:CAMPEP_0197320424 /NCGR_PEP_ID=MMETSP0891-20130614/59747_1 /TAXON_ID=44058 ORGANISM="Aureoumbra lagunensis, Strain CCMP1510" /NCGR_SAMPLE_ID=MMETSP0891 /ASSEMBLY_ACC=CAM_ASM_000534 /LENGTH=561 /DNA_ID=CAMNT_0042811801 /DNA_START=106 /DNA_END=1791 /DNA_ORIENTATION=+
MYQFRPACGNENFEKFMLSEQRECSASDKSTDLRFRVRPPEEIAALVHAFDRALPTLGHYEPGWVQVNVTLGEDGLNPHVDKFGWGDLIVVFTTHQIQVELCNAKHERSDTIICKCSFTVPANAAYVLAGNSRTIACHAANLPKDRIGVVVRYYLRDLCNLGARDFDGETIYYNLNPERCGQEVVARWLNADSKHDIQDDQSSPSICKTYRSCYPGRLLEVKGSQADQTCKIQFFEHSLDAADGPAISEVPARYVLDTDISTRWFNEPQDPLAASFRESLIKTYTYRALPSPRHTADTRPSVTGEQTVPKHTVVTRLRPRQTMNDFLPPKQPSKAMITSQKMKKSSTKHAKNIMIAENISLSSVISSESYSSSSISAQVQCESDSDSSDEVQIIEPPLKKIKASRKAASTKRVRSTTTKKDSKKDSATNQMNTYASPSLNQSIVASNFDQIPPDFHGGYQSDELMKRLAAFLRFKLLKKCRWPPDNTYDDPSLLAFFDDESKLPGRTYLIQFVLKNREQISELSNNDAVYYEYENQALKKMPNGAAGRRPRLKKSLVHQIF